MAEGDGSKMGGGASEGNHVPDSVSLCKSFKEGKTSERIRRELELVPEIGSRWRWYDVPYRILRWFLSSWRRRLVPWRLRYRLGNALNFFLAFNHYDMLKVKSRSDPFENLVVPAEASISQGGIWVTEIFPPSHYSALLEALSANGWDHRTYLRQVDGTNAEQVTQARRGQGFAWKSLGSVANPESRRFAFDAKREVLPEEFDLVELTAVQLGSSLTIVVAFFHLSQTGANSLNTAWKAEYEPTLRWRGLRRPQVDDRRAAAIHAIQSERQRIHDRARNWLGKRCGGFFSATNGGHPVVDFNLFQQFEPTAFTGSIRGHEALDALGMEGNGLYEYVSEQLPGTAFVQGPRSFRRPTDPLQNCWGVVSAHETFAKLNEQPGYGEKPYSVDALTAMANRVIPSFLLHVAVLRYGQQLQEMASTARDTARANHGRFRPRQAERLQQELLSTSLDLPAVARDSAILWKSRGGVLNAVEVRARPTADVRDPPKEFDFIESLGKIREKTFEKLLEDDTVYRTVLASASSLGASAATARLGLRALLVSGLSLVVSAVTLLVANGHILARILENWPE